MSSLNVNLINLPNVFIEQGIKREYPFNNLASHVIGYMANPKKSDIKKNPILEMMDTHVGRSGIEESYEKELRGFPGTKHLEVNAIGREIREISIELLNKFLEDFSKNFEENNGYLIVINLINSKQAIIEIPFAINQNKLKSLKNSKESFEKTCNVILNESYEWIIRYI